MLGFIYHVCVEQKGQVKKGSESPSQQSGSRTTLPSLAVSSRDSLYQQQQNLRVQHSLAEGVQVCIVYSGTCTCTCSYNVRTVYACTCTCTCTSIYKDGITACCTHTHAHAHTHTHTHTHTYTVGLTCTSTCNCYIIVHVQCTSIMHVQVLCMYMYVYRLSTCTYMYMYMYIFMHIQCYMCISLCSGPGGVQCAGSSAEPHQGAQDRCGLWPRPQTTLEDHYTHAQSSGQLPLTSVEGHCTLVCIHTTVHTCICTHTQCALDVTLYNLWVMFTHIMCLRTCTCTCMCVYTVSLCDDCFVKPLMGLIRTH